MADVEEGSRDQTSPKPEKDGIRQLKARLLPGIKYTLLLSLLIYLAMLIVGISSVKKCPVNEDIPLFLYIIGFVGLLSKLVTYLRDRIIPYFKIKYIESALYTTEMVFFFLGTYWVYKEYKPSFNPADGAKYCQKTAYMFAFIYITAFYALVIGILLLLLCCCCCFGATTLTLNSLFGKDEEEPNESQVPLPQEAAADKTTSERQ